MAITKFSRPDEVINEGSDAEYSCRFVDAAVGAAPLAAAAILTITLTLRDHLGGIINSRSAQNVKNLNGGTLASDGTFTMRLIGNADNVIVGTQPVDTSQVHRLQLFVTYNAPGGGTGYLNHEVVYYVKNLTV